MKNQLAYQVRQLLLQNRIPFDKEELDFQIESHPSYPSLHAITGVLDHFNVDNLALEVRANEETLSQLPKTFLAQLKTENGEEFAVVTHSDLGVEALFAANRKSKLPKTEFLENFTGIVVAVEKSDNQEGAKKNDLLWNNSLLILTLLALMSLVLLSGQSGFSITHFILSIAGVVISSSIIKQDLGLKTTIGNAFCSETSENVGCNGILKSKGATLFGSYKLSDLSLVYFSTLAFSSLLLLILGDDLGLLYLIGVLALPITLYSVYYQYAIAKQWCPLCLVIVVLLWVQAGISLFEYNLISAFSFSIKDIFIVSAALLSVVTSWNFLMPHIEKLQELKQTKIDYFKFKKNFSLFSTLLKKSPTINAHIPDTPEIIIGQKDAPLSITIITNPFCGHCKAVHTLVENLYKRYSEDLRICIRFNVDISNTKSDVVRISSRLLELYHTTTGVDSCLEAMHGIYNGVAPGDWLEKWMDCEKPEEYINILKQESDWCKTNNINFTPEILINGKSFPNEYDRGDLVYFIEDLTESCQKENSDISSSLETVH